MKKRRNIFMLLMLCTSINISAQKTESFDLSSFSIGQGWKKDIKTDVVSYTITNTSLGGYCVIAVYKNIASLGTLDKDFDNEWKDLVSSRFSVKDVPQTNSGKRADGWFSKAGAALINDGNGDAIALLSVFNNGGRMISVLVLMNKEEYMNDADKFLSSLKLKAPPAGNNTNIPAPAQTSSSGNGISISTTNFNDGWTSTIHKDWVLVKKGNSKVYLYYFFALGSDMRPPNGNIRDNLWNKVVKKRFKILSENESRKTMINEWKEGEAIDNETGERVYLAMSWNGGFYLAATPDKQTSYQLFPSPDDLNNMTRYNKFAISAKDITGTWQSGGSQTVQWYNEVTGLYTGASLAASSAVFTFNSNSTYISVHNGASGAVVGGMSTFQQQYKGKYTLNNWLVTATNRYQGKTHNFDAHFQAVRGGRLLYMNNNAGENYLLVKVK